MNAEQKAKLATELALPAYAQWLLDSPGTVAAMLNTVNTTMVKAIRTTTAQAWAAAGPYARIVDAANNPEHPMRASCLMLRETLSSGVDIHVELPDVQGMLIGWVQTDVITEAERTALMAKAEQPASRAEQLGIGVVTFQDVIEALP
jgi:hypothetical protein